MSEKTENTNNIPNKVYEHAIDQIIDNLFDFGEKIVDNTNILTKAAYKKYLTNAYKYYNSIKTIATGSQPRSIIGYDNIYIQPNLLYNGKKIITTKTISNLIDAIGGKHILIIGSGGMGKSMLMRYLFLNTINKANYIPVLIELRKINKQPTNERLIETLICDSLNNFGAKLSVEQLEFSLEKTKYLFLLDGLDEVPEIIMAGVVEAIQCFSGKYPEHCYIITSRRLKNQVIHHFQTFKTLETCPLTNEQACTLIRKIPESNDLDLQERAVSFCQQLNYELFETHYSFASNPLLLTMMFLTFIDNNSIPNHEAEFYENAYVALYNRHDVVNKVNYIREFKSNNLSRTDFKSLFSRFCFCSYLNNQYEFTVSDIIKQFEESIEKLHLNVNALDYLSDIVQIVCLIVEDGRDYRFVHRSFQTYFAACYTKELTDASQKEIYAKYYMDFAKTQYFSLIYQIDKNRFLRNALEKDLRNIKDNPIKEENKDYGLIRMLFSCAIVNCPQIRLIPLKNNWASGSTYARYNCRLEYSLYLYMCISYDIKKYTQKHIDFKIGTQNISLKSVCIYTDEPFEIDDTINNDYVLPLTQNLDIELQNEIVRVFGFNGLYKSILDWFSLIDAENDSSFDPSKF